MWGGGVNASPAGPSKRSRKLWNWIIKKHWTQSRVTLQGRISWMLPSVGRPGDDKDHLSVCLFTCLVCSMSVLFISFTLYPSTRCSAGFTGHRCEQAVLKTVSNPKRMWTLSSTPHVITGVSPLSCFLPEMVEKSMFRYLKSIWWSGIIAARVHWSLHVSHHTLHHAVLHLRLTCCLFSSDTLPTNIFPTNFLQQNLGLSPSGSLLDWPLSGWKVLKDPSLNSSRGHWWSCCTRSRVLGSFVLCTVGCPLRFRQPWRWTRIC